MLLSSPYARCHDFAHIAFGRMLLDLLSQHDGRQARIAHSLALLRQPVQAEQNRVLVSHP